MSYLQAKEPLYKQMPQKVKKLVVVLAISTLLTKKKMAEKEELERVSFIWYFVIFKNHIKALLDSRSEINAISQVFAFQLDFKISKTKVGA